MEERKYRHRTDTEKRNLCEQYTEWDGSKAQFCQKHDLSQSYFNKMLKRFGFGHLVGVFGTDVNHEHDGNDERYKPTKADVVQLTPPTAHDGYALTLHVGDSHLHFEELPPADWLVELMRGLG